MIKVLIGIHIESVILEDSFSVRILAAWTLMLHCLIAVGFVLKNFLLKSVLLAPALC